MSKHKCYISYKFEDVKYKDEIVRKYADVYFIDKSQKIEIDSDNPDYIMQEIRNKYLNDSTVTILLIGTRSGENYRDYNDIINGYDSQIIIRREVISSLYNGNGNRRSGLLGVVLPTMYDKIYKGHGTCECCGKSVDYVYIDDDTVIKEFNQNYYLKQHENSKCKHYSEDDRYAVLVKYDDFMVDPESYIELAYQKTKQPISDNVIVRHFK